MKYLFFSFFILLSCFSSAQTFVLDSADVKTEEAILKALYEVISGPAGQKRNWDRFRALLRPEARLNALGKDKEGKVRFRTMTPDDYITQNGAFLEQNGFFEQEIHRVTERFGLVTHVFSTYQARKTADGEVFMRGINSIQLAYDGKRWWIVSILWNAETPENPIPQKYLKK